MARGKQHLKRRPTANAGVAPQPAPRAAKRVKHESWEDQLFFSRLRVHAKWVFVFLAFAFALGFVLFGVGSGTSGITEAMQSLFHRSSGGTSLSALQKSAKQHQKDPKAWRDLATKLETEQKTDRAATALKHYLTLKPKDESALQELAGLYVTRAGQAYNVYAQYNNQAQLVSPNSLFRPPASSPLGKALSTGNPIVTSENTALQKKLNAALTQLNFYNSESETAYKRLVTIAPLNATYQLQLGEVATNLGDTKTAKVAYTKFLKLAPNDPLASLAKKRLKALAPTATAKPSGG